MCEMCALYIMYITSVRYSIYIKKKDRKQKETKLNSPGNKGREGGAWLMKGKVKLPLGCCSNLLSRCIGNLLASDADFPAQSSDFMLFT